METQLLTPKGTNLTVGKKLAESEGFTLYACDLEDGQTCLFKIATSKGYNPSLDREAFLLQSMAERAALLEEEYGQHKKDKNVMLNYRFFFPRLIESFVSEEQGGRRVNLLSFSDIAEDVSELVPLSLILSRDRQRVDPRTSAWIMRNLLKMLDFLHAQGISGEALDTNNILINRERHIVAVFDWSEANIASAPITDETTSSEIAEVAQSVIEVLGGDSETFSIPPDEQLVDTRYADFLRHFASGSESSAFKAHDGFRQLVRDLWPREFYPYTTHRI